MKQATITIPDELEQAIERYRQGFANPPEFDDVIVRAIEHFMATHGYIPQGTPVLSGEYLGYVPSTGGKPRPLANAPILDDAHSVSRAVIEDRQ